MRRLGEILERRAAVAAGYDRRLRGIDGLVLPPLELKDIRISWFVYAVRLAACHGREDRDAVIDMMAERGVACGRYFAPIHRQPAFADAPVRAALPVTEAVSDRTIALPFFTRLGEDDQAWIADALRTAIERLGRSAAERAG
jgi:dTDP-4-amino-4,6-dideoxygalactose transaminase